MKGLFKMSDLADLPWSDGLHLDPDGVSAFLRSVDRGWFDEGALREEEDLPAAEVARIRTTLLALKLLRPAATDPQRLEPNSPGRAAAEVVSPVHETVYRLQREASRLQGTLLSLESAYQQHVRSRDDTSLEVIDDWTHVRAMIAEQSWCATTEVLAILPGGLRTAETLAETLPRNLAMLERGVRLRVIYQHTARTSQVTRSHVTSINAAGGLVRTVGHFVEGLVVFDQETAFLPTRTDDGTPPGAAVVRSAKVTRFLAAVFEYLWAEASPFLPSVMGYADATGDLRSAVARVLAQGLKDGVAARRLGMSERTFRRHVSHLMTELNATSRFQAGVLAARAGLLGAEGDGEEETGAET
ncbi:regulatory protein, luxR family [Streptomyces sp. MnatMP-M27]|nr:regulatory protein, luxR family [Streptomyces sp. MnatMP-M27]